MGCKPAPTCAAALAEASRRWPGRAKASDGICGDAQHQARKSDHNPAADGYAHAYDLTHDPKHGVDTYDLADKIRLRCKAGVEKRVKYIISNRRIADPRDGWAWRSYSGSNPHDKHFHISVTAAATHQTGDWFAFDPPRTLKPIDATTPKPPEEIDDMADPAVRAQLDRIEAALRTRGFRLVVGSTPAVWLTDGLTRRWVQDGDHLAGLANLYGLSRTPDVWNQSDVEAVPVVPGSPLPPHA